MIIFLLCLRRSGRLYLSNLRKISNEFQLTTFANGQQVAQEQLAQTQAIALSVWADVPEAQTSREVIQAIFGSKRPLAKNL